MSVPSPAIQDFYPEDFAHCHGCGRLNTRGMQIKSRWDGDGPDLVAHYTRARMRSAFPGLPTAG